MSHTDATAHIARSFSVVHWRWRRVNWRRAWSDAQGGTADGEGDNGGLDYKNARGSKDK